MVPQWIRGAKEEAFIFDGIKIAVPINVLGGSVATPIDRIKAEIIEVKNQE